MIALPSFYFAPCSRKLLCISGICLSENPIMLEAICCVGEGKGEERREGCEL